MLKLNLGSVHFRAGRIRPRAMVYVGYHIGYGDFRIGVCWAPRGERRPAYLPYRVADPLTMGYPMQRDWSIPLPRWLGDCMTCPAPVISKLDETAAWMRAEAERCGYPGNAARRWCGLG